MLNQNSTKRYINIGNNLFTTDGKIYTQQSNQQITTQASAPNVSIDNENTLDEQT